MLLVRDCGRDGAGSLATIVPVVKAQASPRAPAEMIAPEAPATVAVSSHLGPAWATLVGGVFGDPLLHRARLQPGKALLRLADQPIVAGKILLQKDYTVKAVVCDHNIPSVSYSLEFHREIKVRKERLAAAGWPAGPWLGRLKLCVCTGGMDKLIDLPDGSRKSAAELIDELLIILPGKKLSLCYRSGRYP